MLENHKNVETARKMIKTTKNRDEKENKKWEEEKKEMQLFENLSW